MPQFGWEPHVLTARNAYDYYHDPSLQKDIVSGIRVHRTPAIEPMKWVRKWVKRASLKRSVSKGGTLIVQGGVKKWPWLLKLKESIFIPDGEIGWLPFAVWKGLRIIRKEKIDLIFSTSRPYTGHLIACLLKKWTGKPWIADFRDPWSLSFQAPQFSWRRWADQKLERWVCHHTDHMVVVTPSMENEFKTIHPKGRYSTITNGYDENDFQNIDGVLNRSDRFNITYTGILYKERSPRSFLLALADLLMEEKIPGDRILVRFVGQMDNPGETDNYRFLASLPLNGVVELIPYASHARCIQYMMAADALLLIIHSGKGSGGIMTGKIFEYLRSGKPVLCMVPEYGDAAEVVRETNAGRIVSPDSVEEIKKAILCFYRAYEKGTLKRMFSKTDVDQYSRSHLTGKLANLCDRFVEYKAGRIGSR
jgi:glycosyltransferase involved in cell wall biosynthesis